eukprot:TRINITY_DN6003_c0_g1_i3.p1 TRINITY_DN6003_c0_g1~~TRINITY_DN6003_c0_g1_i3.p1  ORF type:complete len:178 (-),score=54.76 TRINITY_DN6003_c0_g1_i3:144-677(-)
MCIRDRFKLKKTISDEKPGIKVELETEEADLSRDKKDYISLPKSVKKNDSVQNVRVQTAFQKRERVSTSEERYQTPTGKQDERIAQNLEEAALGKKGVLYQHRLGRVLLSPKDRARSIKREKKLAKLWIKKAESFSPYLQHTEMIQMFKAKSPKLPKKVFANYNQNEENEELKDLGA